MSGYPRTMARMPNRADLESAVDAAINLGKAQAKALAALPGAINAVAEAANNINATANEARAVIRKAQAVTDRLDSMLDHVEPAVSEITPTLQALKEAQQRIVAMTGSTEKLASFVDDAGAGLSRLAGLSGASGLFNRLAAATKPEPTSRPLAAVRNEDAPELLPAETPTEEVLAELVGADADPIELDDPEIHDADLVAAVLEDVPIEETDLAAPAEDPLIEDTDLAAPAEDPLIEDTDLAAPAEDPLIEDTDLADGGDLVDEELADAELAETEREGPELIEEPSVAAYDYFGNGNSSQKGQDNGEDRGTETGSAASSGEDPPPDDALHPVELGSESDGPDVTESATG
jgi:hypothetical protein